VSRPDVATCGGPAATTARGNVAEHPSPRAELVPPSGGAHDDGQDDRLPVGELALLFVAVPVLATVIVSLF
jgi:hypothetical protein